MEDNLGHLRKSYDKGALDCKDLKGDPLGFFHAWMQIAQQEEKGLEANAMTLTTLGTDGFPKARVVLLKAYSPKGFVFYTNFNSEKGRAIAHHPQVGLSFFWPTLERQVIVKGIASKVADATAVEYFKSRPEGSQLGALVSPQSQVIPDRTFLEKALEKAKNETKGTPLEKPSHWGGYTVAPQEIEFWQGRPNRLHDRVRCLLQHNGSWNIERLAP
jgi:pyridoxamine 5'-phosphate oxidase